MTDNAEGNPAAGAWGRDEGFLFHEVCTVEVLLNHFFELFGAIPAAKIQKIRVGVYLGRGIPGS